MEKQAKPNFQDFRPSDFMRVRRPHLFSDSQHVADPSMTREMLDYHLDTLTNRRQENEFEYFARLLAEKELCPNLRPQTGPVGGGDSKADTETYPVAEALSSRWYVGVGRNADKERWAFAFSAKRDWRAKVQSDVRSIANTGRDYKLIYFISNQYVKDKARAEVEDKLRKLHHIDIRILDRGWILDCIFKNDRLQIAVDGLKLTVPSDGKIIAGPRDVERQTELNDLEEKIGDVARYEGVEYQLAEDCLRAALIARGLERPRVDVEGRFDRAERIAEKVGDRQQRLRIAYSRAWTVFWWFNDFYELNKIYRRVEELATGTSQAIDLEYLTNLWMLLNSTVNRGQLDHEVVRLDDRTAQLRANLERLIAGKDRPTNALQARTSRILLDLHLALASGEPVDRLLAECREIIKLGRNLVNFPVKPLIDVIREFGEVFVNNPAYDALFESVVGVIEKRRSTGDVGRLLLQRGLQKLRSGARYDAIRLLGRSELKLAMQEYRSDLVTAVAACGYAYEQAGLLWAGRANMLAAANFALTEFWENGNVSSEALHCLQRLIWIEIQLGRVPHIFAWLQLTSKIAALLQLEGEAKHGFIEQRRIQDLVLGILLLRTDLWDLRESKCLPLVLQDFGLPHSRMAILYALGHEDVLRAEGLIPETESREDVRQFFGEWNGQPASRDLPDRPMFGLRSDVELKSFVLGCEITVTASNSLVSIQIGETILGALESLLATSLEGEIFPYRPELKFKVRASDFISSLPEHEISEINDVPLIDIRYPASMNLTTISDRTAYREWVLSVVSQTIAQIAVVKDANTYLSRLARDEAGFARALNLADISVCINNLLGEKPRVELGDWLADYHEEGFELRRTVPWNDGQTNQNPIPADGEDFGEENDESSRAGFGIDNLRHIDRRIISLINIPLWDKAKWIGTVYGYSPNAHILPFLALGFKDENYAQAIFRGLRARLGTTDKLEELAVSIITGISKDKPMSYAVIISSNFRNAKQLDAGKHALFVARINRMDPVSSENLDRFLKQYNEVGRYCIYPACFSDVSKPPKVFFGLGIDKRELRIRQAWQLTENDLEIVALTPADSPVIPEGIEDPPVARALEAIAKRRLQRRGSENTNK